MIISLGSCLTVTDLLQGATPTNTRSCLANPTQLSWEKTKYSSDFEAGKSVDIESLFKANGSGKIVKHEVAFYYRDFKIFGFKGDVDADFEVGKPFVFTHTVNVPKTILPTLSIQIRLKTYNAQKEELTCVSFDLYFPKTFDF